MLSVRNNWNEYMREYRQKHPEKIREMQIRQTMRNWLLRNREYHNKASANWAKNHHEYYNNYHRLYYHKKRTIEGDFTLKDWEDLKKRYNYTCPMCGKKEPEIKLEIDHIVPISKGGTNYISNIQPLCRSCNARKWNLC